MLHKISQISALAFTDMATPSTVSIEGISQDVSSTYFITTSFEPEYMQLFLKL